MKEIVVALRKAATIFVSGTVCAASG